MRARGRLTDSGLRDGEENLALDRALIAAAGEGGPLLRFHSYRPTVSVGAHERIGHAVRSEFCARRGIPVIRRITGGGALYLDAGQLCWTLCLPSRSATRSLTLESVLHDHQRAAADALARLGLFLSPCYPGGLEHEGRKVGAVFATRVGETWVLQGTLLCAVDTQTLLKALRVPTEKLSEEGILSARQRLATLTDLFGRPPEREALRSALAGALEAQLERRLVSGPMPELSGSTAAEPVRPDMACDHAWARGAATAFRRTAGGTLYAAVRLEGERMVEVSVSGSVQLAPQGGLRELEQTLRGWPARSCTERLSAFFQRQTLQTVGFQAEDVDRVLQAALDRNEQEARLGLDRNQANTLMVHGPGTQKAHAVLARASVMLVPYCAKPPGCKWRHRDGCPECGQCEVGDAYRLARERGMRVVTITNFEHLQRTLAEMTSDGVEAYVGMCCSNFYLKRQFAFDQAGVPAVLMDISGANCYELRQEEQAYAGTFAAQAHLNGDVVERVMQFVPPVRQQGRHDREPG